LRRRAAAFSCSASNSCKPLRGKGSPRIDESENLAFSGDEERVLVLRFHADGGPVVFTGQIHQDFPAALEALSLDRDSKALAITGTGDSFMEEIDAPSVGEIFESSAWEKTRTEGAKVLQGLLELPMPVVGVASGPATVHSECLLLSDIHIASEGASYGDTPHPAFGISGVGLHLHKVFTKRQVGSRTEQQPALPSERHAALVS
jgi:enoyl-CoA hydratase/carnithine racemase